MMVEQLTDPTSLSLPVAAVGTRYLRFQLAHLALLIPLGCLREVLLVTPAQVLPVPDMPCQWLGLLGWRTQAIWLLDLGQVITGSPGVQGRWSVLLTEIADPTGSGEPLLLGLRVDSVQTIVSVVPERILPLALEVVEPRLQVLFQGYVLSESGQPLLIFNPQGISQVLPA
ncbi:MAG: chemotaxis protein CheW [Thermostichales cyanobacterium BF4_bins_65]